MINLNIKAKIDYSILYSKFIDKWIIDLLKRMLERNPYKRISST